MRISVIAKPRARKPGIQKLDEKNYVVAVHEPPIDGKANLAIIAALANYFSLPKSHVTLVSGKNTRLKVFECSVVSFTQDS